MPIGWAIVSTGRHPNIKMAPAVNAAADSTIAAAVSRDLERAREFAARHNAAKAYDDMEAMLAEPTVDVVYIASPNALHAEYTIKAARAGKHVLVEKPMALTVAECQRMIDACASAGVRLGVGFHLRMHPGHQRLRKLVQGGDLGTIALVEANWSRGIRGEVGPPQRPPLQAWWDDPALVGAGAFMATGVHCVDTLRYVLGKEVVEVVALTDATPERPLEELLTLSLRFEDGSLGTVMTGRRTPDYARNDIVVYGSLGRAGVHGSMGTSRTGALAMRTNAFTLDESYDPPDDLVLYTQQVEAFNRAVTDAAEPAATGLDGLRAAQVTAAMLESSRSGRRIAIQ